MKNIHRDVVPIGNSSWTRASFETKFPHAIENTDNIETTMKVFNKTNFMLLSSDLNDQNKFLSKWNLYAPFKDSIGKSQLFFFSQTVTYKLDAGQVC